ncbi:hypothetical protein MASR1M90_18740 [Desulfovibrionales bacterium]
MALSPVAMKAYMTAADIQGGLTGLGTKQLTGTSGKSFADSLQQSIESNEGKRQSLLGTGLAQTHGEHMSGTRSFSETIGESLGKVNEMQAERNRMIEEFASGKSENVHELMISLQKAGLAMDMTSAVRNKIMNAYQELMRIQF